MKKIIVALMSFSFISAIGVARPSSVQAVAADYWIGPKATAATVGSGTDCDEPDVRYTGALNGYLNDALDAVLAVVGTDNVNATIYICDNAGAIQNYAMDFDAVPVDLDSNPVNGGSSISIIGVTDAVGADTSAANAANIVISGAPTWSPFEYGDADVTIKNLTVADAFDDNTGGAIHVESFAGESSLTLDHVVIRSADIDAGQGAGAYVDGDVTITDSTFEQNTAGGNGGAIYAVGDVTVTDSTFVKNGATYGGAIYAEGDVVVTTSVFGGYDGESLGNNATTRGGAIFTEGDATATGSEFYRNTAAYDAGAVGSVGDLISVASSTFAFNEAVQKGGALWGNDIDVSDSNFSHNVAGTQGGAIRAAGMSVDIDASLFNDNVAGSEGGAAYILTAETSITDTEMDRNTAGSVVGETGNGGAIHGEQGGQSLHVAGSLFVGNVAGSDGGALSVDAGDIIVDDSTFETNSSVWGAITIDDGSLSLTDVTMDANTSSSEGGAAWVGEGLTVVHSTFTNNTSVEDGGVFYLNSGNVEIRSSIFKGNTSGSEGGAAYLYDCSEVLISRNTFTGNSAENSGGGAINFDCSDTSSEAQISHNTFLNNVAADYGGATDDDDDKILVYSANTFTGNRAVGSGADGGAVWISGGKFYNNRFTRNLAEAHGGAIYVGSRGDFRTAPRNKYAGNRAGRGSNYYYSTR